MKSTPRTIRHDGKTWTVGQTARVTDTGYMGRINSLWPGSCTQPPRAHVQREGDIYPRAVALDKLEDI